MRNFVPLLILMIAVTALCVWDGIHTEQVFDKMESQSEAIYSSVLVTDISDPTLGEAVVTLNDYWTKEMDTLCISISRKDLQPVSDYLQYLYSAIINESQEDAITYSRLLYYNVAGLSESTGLGLMNLL